MDEEDISEEEYVPTREAIATVPFLCLQYDKGAPTGQAKINARNKMSYVII